MTKEELKKEAEEKLPQVELDYCHGFMNPCEPNELPYIELVRFRTGFERGYLAGAEPREKQIAELKEQLGNLYEIIKRPYQFTAPQKIQMVEEAEQFLSEVSK